MCYFDQTRWACGNWKWGNFRQQCNKEYRTGETCGLKLVYDTSYRSEQCRLCRQIEQRDRRLRRLNEDIRHRVAALARETAADTREQLDAAAERSAIARLEEDRRELEEQIERIRKQHKCLALGLDIKVLYTIGEETLGGVTSLLNYPGKAIKAQATHNVDAMQSQGRRGKTPSRREARLR